MSMYLRSAIRGTERLAEGHQIRELRRLNKVHGAAHWRKCKGIADVELPDGTVVVAEIHWYEAHGKGRRELKIKRFVDPP